MAVKYRRSLIITSILLTILICFDCFYLGYQNYREPRLGGFKIIGLSEEPNSYYLKVEESHNAVLYEIIIKNEAGEEIYKTESTESKISLKDFQANYGDNLKIEVLAKNKNGTSKEAEDTFTYTWTNASFQNINSRYVDASKGLSLFLYGYQQNAKYKLKLEYLNQVIHEEPIETDNIYIPYQILEGYAGRITAKLYTEQDCLISTYNFYINTPVVGKVKITSPSNGYKTRWNDISLSWTGGENATEYHLLLFEENNLTETITLPKTSKEFRLPASYLKEEKNYYISLEAIYEDYQEIAEYDGIDIYVSKKETTNPVYNSHNPTFIKAGTKITLDSRTPNATIYYTTDGSDPGPNSEIYKEPITINENTMIKTYAVSQNRYDSEINTYDYQVRDKQLIVYLSPSNQYLNYGNSDAGYTTEMQEMNRLADFVEKILKENGVTVYRNRPSGNINQYLSESNYVKSDLHLAIHSNASASKQAQGIEIFVDKATSKSLSVATNIYQNLYKTYPYKNGASTDRGVRYANGSLGEANDSFIPCGTLIEVAYHDNYDDAKWILENREEIAKNIANSILTYYN